MVTNYERGRAFEYKVKRYLEKRGYFVVRSAGSRFPDLIAIKNGKVLAIEVKNHKPSDAVIQEVEERAHELLRYGITPCLAYPDEDGKIRVVFL